MPNSTYTNIPLTAILDDTTYQFRDQLRLDSLRDSIDKEGIQFPVLLRPQGDSYQLISGFRRVNAARELGLKEVPAIVKELTDQEAYKVSIIENEQRKTLNDMDRCRAILQYRQAGYKVKDLEAILHVGKKQLERLQKLWTLPESIKKAMEEQEGFTTTHAVVLNGLKTKYPKLRLKDTITAVVEGELGVRAMKKMVEKKYGNEKAAKAYVELDGKVVKFCARSVNTEKLDDDAKQALKTKLTEIMELLK